MNILVLCTGNSARSILLEALLNDLGGGRIRAYSAGSQPVGKVNPFALTVLADKGHGIDGYRSKSWDEFGQGDAPQMDAVITVCGSAAAEVCPMWPGAPLKAHWGIEDPAAVPAAQAPQAFAEAYAILRRRAEAFLAADVSAMDAAPLKAHLDQSGGQP